MGITPAQAKTLNAYVNKAKQAQEREHNERNAPDSTPAINKVTQYAKYLGFGTYWPGLYPVFTKNGRDFFLE